jgi:hypothetical protein
VYELDVAPTISVQIMLSVDTCHWSNPAKLLSVKVLVVPEHIIDEAGVIWPPIG